MGLCPRPHWGSLQHPRTLQLDFRDPILREWEGREKDIDEVRGGDEREEGVGAYF